MDITMLFKACVKTIRTRNKALGVSLPELDKNRILNNRKVTNNEFNHKAKVVLNEITRLRDFLLEHRKAYLNFMGHLSTIPQMSDYDRDQIDLGAQKIMKACSHVILEFKRDSTLQDGLLQLVEHQDSVIDLLDSYLKTVCKIYSELKAIRTKRCIEIQKLARLESEVLESDKRSEVNYDRQVVLSSDDRLTEDPDTNSSGEESNRPDKQNNLSPETVSISSLAQEDELTGEELQMFESENELLYNDLNSLSDEVRQIESKVVHISELQQVFTEKVLDQDKDIERIFGTVVGTTENLRDANTQIRQAIQSNAGLRVYVLFFLLVMSLSLLFLDWYND